ncbi:MAG: hypothetical protein NXI10_14995 [bacterium]|nr:hypothetical protein [bacterium]
MKKRTIIILGIIAIVLIGCYWFATHYPTASDQLTLDDGTVISLSFSENIMVFLDPEVTKTLIINTREFELHHEDWSEDYLYTLMLVKWDGEKHWIIQNRYWSDLIAPYGKKNASFKEHHKFEIPIGADTLYHITFENFKLTLK